MKTLLQTVLLALALPAFLRAQSFYLGADLSYANQMEDCGAVFKDKGEPKDVYQIFADHGNNLAGFRLWVDPIWQNSLEQPDGVKPQYSDLDDVTEAIERAKAAGMQVLLGFHYSDAWADPGRQVIPARWRPVADDLDALKDSVYQYTVNVLRGLDGKGLMPDIVKIGNETNSGILVHRTMNDRLEPSGTVSNSWARHAVLFNAAIRAVREVGATASINPKIALHFAGLRGLQGRYQNLINNGVTDFDIMGFSYYYAWHEASIVELGRTIRDMRSRFPDYEIIPVETGYLWTTADFDALPNIITEPDPDYLPVIPEKQLEYMIDYTREVMRTGGTGVIFWEPAWVSTPCRTPWGQGSSHDHVAFFDPVDTNFMENGGGRWTERRFYDDPEAHKVTFQVDMTGQDVSGGVYIAGSFAGEGGQPAPMAHVGNNVYYYFIHLPAGATGGYHYLNGTDPEARETVPVECAEHNGTDRRYEIPNGDLVILTNWESCLTTVMGPVKVTFAVDMTGQDVSRGVYITGHITEWDIVRMRDEGGGVYTYTTEVQAGSVGAYYYLTTPTWDNYLPYRESVPPDCATWWGSDRGYVVPAGDAVFAVRWGTCETFALPTSVNDETVLDRFLLRPVYPNPFRGSATISYGLPSATYVTVAVYDVLARLVETLVDGPQVAGSYAVSFEAGDLPAGMYVISLETKLSAASRKIVLVE